MQHELIDGTLSIFLDTFWFLGIASLSYFLGRFIKARIRLFQALSIPVPFLGGFPIALTVLFLRLANVCTIQFDTAINSLVLNFFLTMLALMASFKLIIRGSALSLIFWSLAVVLGVLQALVGIAGTQFFDLHPHLGVLIGTISMMGSYETVSSFAPALEKLNGIANAEEIALGVVTLGMVTSMLVSCPLAEFLIHKYKILNPTKDEFDNARLTRSILRSSRPFYQTHTVECMKIVALTFVCLALGRWFNAAFLENVLIPEYVSSMIFAVLIRNIADASGKLSIDGLALRTLEKLSLVVFIAVSTCSLRLDLLGGLNKEVLLIFLAEMLLTVIFARCCYFSVLGKNFRGVLLTAGGLSFSMGVAGNGLSNMQSLCEKYGPSTEGFLVMSIVGLVLLNISNVFLIQFLLLML